MQILPAGQIKKLNKPHMSYGCSLLVRSLKSTALLVPRQSTLMLLLVRFSGKHWPKVLWITQCRRAVPCLKGETIHFNADRPLTSPLLSASIKSKGTSFSLQSRHSRDAVAALPHYRLSTANGRPLAHQVADNL